MSELEEIVSTFKVSRPVFKLVLSSRGGIDADVRDPVYKYRPTATEGDIIGELVISHYSETFHRASGAFKIDPELIIRDIIGDVRSSMVKFLEMNLKMKSPKQSKVYRWVYRNMPNDSAFNNILIMLYKYMRSFTNDDMRFTIGNLEHANNAIAILIAMEEKYSE